MYIIIIIISTSYSQHTRQPQPHTRPCHHQRRDNHSWPSHQLPDLAPHTCLVQSLRDWGHFQDSAGLTVSLSAASQHWDCCDEGVQRPHSCWCWWHLCLNCHLWHRQSWPLWCFEIDCHFGLCYVILRWFSSAVRWIISLQCVHWGHVIHLFHRMFHPLRFCIGSASVYSIHSRLCRHSLSSWYQSTLACHDDYGWL